MAAVAIKKGFGTSFRMAVFSTVGIISLVLLFFALEYYMSTVPKSYQNGRTLGSSFSEVENN